MFEPFKIGMVGRLPTKLRYMISKRMKNPYFSLLITFGSLGLHKLLVLTYRSKTNKTFFMEFIQLNKTYFKSAKPFFVLLVFN